MIELVFTIAEADQLERAIAFRDEIYRSELGSVPTDLFDSQAQHLIAVEPTGRLVATFRIVGPDARPFEFERFLRIDDLLPSKATPAWVGRLCIDKSRRSLSSVRSIHFSLLRLMLLVAKKCSYSQLFLYAGLHLISFYRLALFTNVGSAFVHPVWGQQQLMFLDLSTLNRPSPHSMVHRFLSESPPSNFKL